jgi:hypothetical protein
MGGGAGGKMLHIATSSFYDLNNTNENDSL